MKKDFFIIPIILGIIAILKIKNNISIYYSSIAFISLMTFLIFSTKKNKDKKLIKEANNLLKKEKINKIKKQLKNSKEEIKIKTNLDKIPRIESGEPKKEIKKEVQKEQTTINENEVYKNSEEKLEKEMIEEIKTQKEKPKKKN